MNLGRRKIETRTRDAGFTLLELIVTIAVASIILGIAVPSFRAMSINNRLATQANDIVGAINLARSEAIKRNRSVSLCRVRDGNDTTCETSSELVQRDILAEGTIGDFPVRVIEEGAISDMANKKGWYMDLVSPIHGVEGERMVVPNRFQGTALIGTTRIPDAQDPCRPSGKGFVMAINPFTGARLDRTFFDVSMDGLFTEADMLLVDGVPTIVSGIGMDSSPNNPIFIEDVMQVGLDDGTTKTIKTQGSAVQAQRMSWRELFN